MKHRIPNSLFFQSLKSIFLLLAFYIGSDVLCAQVIDTSRLRWHHEEGRKLYKERKHQESIAHFEICSKGYHALGYWKEYFRAEIDVVFNLLDQSRYKDAQTRIEKARKDFSSIPFSEDLRVTHANLTLANGNVYSDQSMHEKSIPLFQELVEICKDREDKTVRKILSFAYNNMGNAYNKQRRFDKSLDALSKAFDIKKEILGETHQSTLNTLRNLGTAYHELGYHDIAIEYQMKVLKQEEADNEVSGISHVYHDLSRIYQHKRDYATSREYAMKALELDKKTHGEIHYRTANNLHQIGNAYETEKNYKEAIKWYQKSIDMRFQLNGGHNYNSSLSLMNIAKSLNWIGQREESIKMYKEVWDLFDRLLFEGHPRYSELWLSMGNAYLDNEEIDKAHELFERAYELVYSHGAEKSFDRAVACVNLATTAELDYGLELCQQGLWEQSVDWDYDDEYDLPDLEQMPNNYWSLRLLDTKGDIWYKKYKSDGDPDHLIHSIASYRRASELIDKSREEYFSQGSKTTLGQEGRDIYEKAVYVSYLLDSLNESGGGLKDAFYFIERGRSLVLLEAITDLEFGTEYVPDSINFKRRSINSDIQKLEIDLQQEGLDETHVASINSQIFELKDDLVQVENHIKDSYPQINQMKKSTDVLTPLDVQMNLEDDELFLEYMVTNEHIFLLSIDKNDSQLFRLSSSVMPQVKEIIEMSKSVTNAQRNGNDLDLFHRFVDLSYSIYESILALAHPSDYTSLTIVPDGLFSFLPFEFLIDEKLAHTNIVDYSSLSYLIRNLDIGYAFSANLHLYKSGRKDYSQDNILAFAPTYDGSNNEILASRSGFTSLKFIKDEASRIVEMMGGSSFVEEEASESNFKLHAPKYRFLHLAMHAFTDEEKPLKSGLIFTDTEDEVEDNVLHNYELYNMNLPAEMVVLSACNTGSGKVEKGEGVMSLARGFRQAGVPNIVMSLWQADDESTSIIMQNFYELLKEGKEKDTALREAKLNYLAMNRKSFPYFWSAFVLMGDDAPISDSINYRVLVLALGISLILGLGFMFFRKMI